jgi:hypothetical protein
VFNLLENILAALGLVAVILAAAMLLLNLERHCDISIKTNNGESCYIIKDRQ